MERATHYRPRISRETRLLVTTALLAVLALWMLARLRFPAPPAEPRAISQLLTSLGASADFDALASQMARVRGLVSPYLSALEFDVPSGDNVSTFARSAYRVGGDIAIVQVPEGGRLRQSTGMTLLAFDAASQLAVVRLPLDPVTITGAPRVVRPPEPPQYVVSTAMYPEGVALQPVFLAAMAELDAPLWSATVWAVPSGTALTPGAFVFTRDGEFAGLAILHRGALAIVSSETVLDEANRLVGRPLSRPGNYKVQVEPLTPVLQRALGSSTGVVVTWVDPAGPGRGVLMTGDVIEGADGRSLPTVEHWQRHLAGLAPGTPVTLAIRRAGASQTVAVTPVAVEESAEGHATGSLTLGIRARAVRGAGSEVLVVEPGSMAARAGVVAGDIVTSIGAAQAPSPAVVAAAAMALTDGQSVLLGVRRGAERRLLVLER